MHISKVVLVNYRNFKRSEFLFHNGVNTIIGENGSGKSNLFKAIRLILDSNLFRGAYNLNENDFHKGLKVWQGHWIVINIEFDNITNSEGIRALFNHNGEILNGKAKGKATYNLIFRPQSHIRKKLSELTPGDKESLAFLQSTISIDDYETVFTGRSSVDFNKTANYTSIVGDFEKVLFPKELDRSLIGCEVPHTLSVAKEVSFSYIKALRDVVSEFNNNKLNPLIKLLRNKSESSELKDYEEITNDIIELNKKIEILDDIVDIKKDISNTIHETAGEAYSPTSMSIKSDLPEEAEKLFKSLNLFISENQFGYSESISDISLGGANLIYMTLKILEFKYQLDRNKSANFLLIEEPEAHIHTHIQKTLFENIKYEDTQIIYSTHSPQLSEVSDIKRVNVLAKTKNGCLSFQPSTGLTPSQITHLQRYLDATRSSLLFAKGVILVEGDAEEILIPVLVKKVLGVSLDELAISLINIRSTGFENVAYIFNEKRLRRNCSIVTDLDLALESTAILPTEKDTIKKYKESMQRSEDSGKQRKIRLESFAKDNDYIKVFYADHTFEVDFIKSGNDYEVKKLISELYSSSPHKEKYEDEITSEEVKIYGKRILRIAKQQGKGWFALNLADQITGVSDIPDYILSAIDHAKANFSKALCARIIYFRLNSVVSAWPTDQKMMKSKLAIEQFIEEKINLETFKSILASAYSDNIIDTLVKGYPND